MSSCSIMIHVANLTHYYGSRRILDDISFEIRPGELVAVMGPNGIGKSTLLSAIAGLLSPIDGEVTIDGLVRRSTPENELAIRGKVAYLADHPWLPGTNTGREILHAVGTVYDIEIRRLSAHIDRLLALFQLREAGRLRNSRLTRMTEEETGRGDSSCHGGSRSDLG